jgi:hypothetical protein
MQDTIRHELKTLYDVPRDLPRQLQTLLTQLAEREKKK